MGILLCSCHCSILSRNGVSRFSGAVQFLFSVFCRIPGKTGNTGAEKLRGRTHPLTHGVYLLYRLFKDSSTKSYGEEKPNRYSTNNIVDCNILRSLQTQSFLLLLVLERFNAQHFPVLAPWSICSRMMREKDELKAHERCVRRQRRNQHWLAEMSV